VDLGDAGPLVADPEPLGVTFHRVGGRVQVTLSGEIDFDVAERLYATVTNALDVPGLLRVEVDLGEVSFLDCAGVSALLRLRADAAAAGYAFVVCDPVPIVWRVLNVTGALEQLLDQRQHVNDR
jgi:anti-anti-sigma factor